MELLRKLSQKSLRNSSFSTGIRRPSSSLYGLGLGDNLEAFTLLKDKYTALVKIGTGNTEAEVAALIAVSDAVAVIMNTTSINSLFVMSEFFDYLRAKLLSDIPTKVQASINVADTLIKNASSYGRNAHYIYHLAGDERFIKTLTRRAKQLVCTPVPADMRAVGKLALDCLQAWGEAFSTEDRKHIYKFMSAYHQLRDKHHIMFPRAPFDPERVPIFLAPLGQWEQEFRLHTPQRSFVTKVEETKVEPVQVHPPSQEDLLHFDESEDIQPESNNRMNEHKLSFEAPGTAPSIFPALEVPSWYTEPAENSGQLVLAPVGAMHTAVLVPYQYPTYEQMRQQQRQAYLQQPQRTHTQLLALPYQSPPHLPPPPPRIDDINTLSNLAPNKTIAKKDGLDSLSQGVADLFADLQTPSWKTPNINKSSEPLKEATKIAAVAEQEPFTTSVTLPSAFLSTVPPEADMEQILGAKPDDSLTHVPPPSTWLFTQSPPIPPRPPTSPLLYPNIPLNPIDCIPPADTEALVNPFDMHHVNDSSGTNLSARGMESSSEVKARVATTVAQLELASRARYRGDGIQGFAGVVRPAPKVDIKFFGATRIVNQPDVNSPNRIKEHIL